MPTLGAEKTAVQAFWDAVPCGDTLSTAPAGSPDYFAEVECARYDAEPFIPEFAGFSNTAGKKVLEIGVGLGTDFVQFVRSGARATGVDLTPRSIELVRRRLELEGLHAELRQADAERLPFADDVFDHVYSWGVLHHTPHTCQAAREAIRVLRPGGTICVMLYGRRSWLSYAFWTKHALLAGRPGRSLSDVLAHHMESVGTKGFTLSEMRELFVGLDELRVQSVVTSYDRRYAGPLIRLTGRRLGWFLVLRGRK